MLKVGIIVHCPSPHQKVWLDEINRVPDTDVVVAYAFSDDPGRTWGTHRAAGRTVQVPPMRGFGGGLSLRNWVADIDRDVWVLAASYAYLRGHVLAAAFTDLQLPWAFLGERPQPRVGVRGMVSDWLLHRLLRRCHGVIGTGVESARRYRSLLGDDRPVMSVPYYIPLDEWLALPLVPAPLPGEPIRFLTVSRVTKAKGLDLLIDACERLPHSGWTLDIFGDGPARRRLQRHVADRSLPVAFHGEIAFDRRHEAFTNTHCFVHPSLADGFGMAPVEALAAGLPVIVSDQTMSAYDFIRDDVNGWIVPCDAGSIAAAMQALMSRPERLPELSNAARASISGYDPGIGARDFVKFCRELVARHRGRRPAG